MSDLSGWLDYADSVQGNMFNSPDAIKHLDVSPTIAQSKVQQFADKAISPFQNAKNNFDQTYNDIFKPTGDHQFGKVIGDLQGLKSNMFGGQQPQGQWHPPTDQHLGPANEYGVRPVLPSYFEQNNKQMQDNKNNNFGIDSNGPAAPVAAAALSTDNSNPLQPHQSQIGAEVKGAAKDALKTTAKSWLKALL